MLRIGDIERMLVNAMVVGARINNPLDALLGHLLALRPDYAGRVTDGVTLGHELVSRRQLIANGVAVMIDQTVEPLRVELTLDDKRIQITAGRLYFGDSDRTMAHGSSEHGRLRDRLLVEPDAEFSWKECFRRTDDGWQPLVRGTLN